MTTTTPLDRMVREPDVLQDGMTVAIHDRLTLNNVITGRGRSSTWKNGRDFRRVQERNERRGQRVRVQPVKRGFQ